jgi:hypothetical protein
MKTWVTYRNDKIGNVRITPDDINPGEGWHLVPNDWAGNPGEALTWFDENMRRIPDADLIALGRRKDMRGRWFSKSAAGETKQVYGLDEEPGEGWTREAPAENEPYQKWDEASGSWTVDAGKKERAELESALGALRSEIGSRDWKIIKAQRLGTTVEEVYPGETEWYIAAVNQINDLEARLESLA